MSEGDPATGDYGLEQLADGASARGQVPVGARVALFPLKRLSGQFDVTELAPQEFRRIDAWEADERPR